MTNEAMAKPAGGDEATQKLSNGRVLSYAFGDVANNLSFQMTSMFLMIYMTDIAGIGAGVAGGIYGVTKVWAGVTDLLAGSTVDRFDTKWGRLRPWILFGSFPLAIVLVLLFSVPAGLSPTMTIVWVLLFDAAFQLCYSFVNIPYGSLSAAMTRDTVDRSRLSGARAIGGAITGVALSAVLAPKFNNTEAGGIRMQFTITTIVLAVLAICMYYLCFRGTREVVPRAPGQVKLSDTLKMVGKNRPLLTLCLGALFLLSAMFVMNAVGMYYARYVLGNAGLFTFLMLAQTVGTVLSASLVPMITVRLGKRIGYMAMGCLAIVGYLIMGLVPSGPSALFMTIVGFFVFGAGSGGTNALMFSMQADTVDYGEWKTGTRSEGGSYSILSFVRKCGRGIGGALGGAVVTAFGYQAGVAQQSPEVLQGIRVAIGFVPAALGAVAVLVIFFYPLSNDQHRDIIADLRARRTAGATEGSDVPAGAAAAEGGVDTSLHPVVTINAEYGTNADRVAQLVGEQLHVPVTGQEFSSEELETADVGGKHAAASEPGGFDRFLLSFRNTGMNDTDYATGADAEADHRLVQDNIANIQSMVRSDGGVIIGHDATAVLAKAPGVVHVRLHAPVEYRVRNAMETLGLSEDVASARRAREDRMRNQMSTRMMRYDPTDPAYYDLVLNAAQMSPGAMADLIVAAYHGKNG
ncbi:cytidylate kinase family protein [Nigerium massiliense]|uniref:cytidylate kinase family protein n=1 Tax=Nigerium massiliense TaxID=1522317 RepID=UPI001C45D2C3|nr:cytidylate kinase family protein [Nigerium massiliense]